MGKTSSLIRDRLSQESAALMLSLMVDVMRKTYFLSSPFFCLISPTEGGEFGLVVPFGFPFSLVSFYKVCTCVRHTNLN